MKLEIRKVENVRLTGCVPDPEVPCPVSDS